MRYEAIPSQLFTENRRRLITQLKPASVAVFHSNDIQPTSADGVRPFIQHSDLFYLTGVDQEETALVLCPAHPNPRMRELLFVRETSPLIRQWEGEKLSKAQATEVSGVAQVHWYKDFEQVFRQVVVEAEHIYLNTNEHLRATIEVETRDARFVRWCREQYPLHRYERLAPIMHYLRAIKAETEIGLIRHACGITGKAFRRVLGFVRPGVWEFEIEAEITHEFLRNRSRGHAYEPIIASGANACVLHYVTNDCQCQEGDTILLDFGAEYANYASDLTRVIPVSGRFGERQKAVYAAVLRTMREVTQMLRPGTTIDEILAETGKLITHELIGLGLLQAEDVRRQSPDAPLYKRYFMHGFGHHLGLNVHDYGHKYRKTEAGMVFTCEPGIYIPEEGLGIRLENDIVITENGPLDLMADIPLEWQEIEELMHSR